MHRLTFRTEMIGDNDRVPALLEAMCVSLVDSKEISDPLLEVYKMGVFTFESPLELEQARTIMKHLVDSEERFIDMHRCYETLAAGDEPDEKWYLHD